MGMELVFGADGVLRDGAQELGRVEPGAEGAHPRLILDGEGYEIARRGRGGWDFSLLEPSGPGTFCEFKLARLRRGGVLRAPGGVTRIGTALAGSSWTVEIPSQPPITVIGRPERGETVDGRSRVATGSGFHDELLVSCEGETPTSGEGRIVLVFACWLIGEWMRMPLAEAGAGGMAVNR